MVLHVDNLLRDVGKVGLRVEGHILREVLYAVVMPCDAAARLGEVNGLRRLNVLEKLPRHRVGIDLDLSDLRSRFLLVVVFLRLLARIIEQLLIELAASQINIFHIKGSVTIEIVD